MSAWPEDQKYAQRIKQGYPLPFIETRISNANGVAAWDSKTIGELEVRGPWVAASYYNAPETHDRWSKDGWFRTGDMATIDPDGCVRLVDRSKDMVKSGGEWISSVDVENELMSHPGTRSRRHRRAPCKVAGASTGRGGVAGRRKSGRRTARFSGKEIRQVAITYAVVFVDELPHTSTGKLLKAELRRKYAAWKWE